MSSSGLWWWSIYERALPRNKCNFTFYLKNIIYLMDCCSRGLEFDARVWPNVCTICTYLFPSSCFLYIIFRYLKIKNIHILISVVPKYKLCFVWDSMAFFVRCPKYIKKIFNPTKSWLTLTTKLVMLRQHLCLAVNSKGRLIHILLQ